MFFCPVCGLFLFLSKKSWYVTMCLSEVTNLFLEIIKKNILQNKKRLYLCTRFRPRGALEREPWREPGARVPWEGFGRWDSVCHSTSPVRPGGETRDESKVKKSNSYNEEFDPGSGWTLAAGLTHASRGAARGSNTLAATGARVRNAYATCPQQGDNGVKTPLIPRMVMISHGIVTKALVVADGHAWH